MREVHVGRRNRVWPWWGWSLAAIALAIATWGGSALSTSAPTERVAGTREFYRAPDLSATLRSSNLPSQAQIGGQLWHATSALPQTESLQATLKPTGEMLAGQPVLGGTLPAQERFIHVGGGNVYVRYAPGSADLGGGS